MSRPPGMHWVFYAVDTGIPWPANETTISFLEHDLILRPSGTDGEAPDIRVKLSDSMEEIDGVRLILKFLSMLSWWEQKPARIDLGALTSFPYRFKIHCLPPPQSPGFMVPNDCQYPTDPKAQLAIALHREALCVNNVFYQFLGFYKIVDCCFDNNENKSRDWMNSTVHSLKESKAVQRVKFHSSNGKTNLGNHLYSKCRSAIAHATLGKNTNPDDPTDIRAIDAELPIIRALAVRLIENEFGLRNMFTKSRAV